jgi:hypothetical protein
VAGTISSWCVPAVGHVCGLLLLQQWAVMHLFCHLNGTPWIVALCSTSNAVPAAAEQTLASVHQQLYAREPPGSMKTYLVLWVHLGGWVSKHQHGGLPSVSTTPNSSRQVDYRQHYTFTRGE